MRDFGFTCSASGCAARSTAALDGVPAGWTRRGMSVYCEAHAALVRSIEDGGVCGSAEHPHRLHSEGGVLCCRTCGFEAPIEEWQKR